MNTANRAYSKPYIEITAVLNDRKPQFPWLYYPQGQIAWTAMDHKYVRRELIEIILAAYDISGQFLGYRNATQDNTLQLCSNSAVRRSDTFRFGTYYTETVDILLARLTLSHIATRIAVLDPRQPVPQPVAVPADLLRPMLVTADRCSPFNRSSF